MLVCTSITTNLQSLLLHCASADLSWTGSAAWSSLFSNISMSWVSSYSTGDCIHSLVCMEHTCCGCPKILIWTPTMISTCCGVQDQEEMVNCVLLSSGQTVSRNAWSQIRSRAAARNEPPQCPTTRVTQNSVVNAYHVARNSA